MRRTDLTLSDGPHGRLLVVRNAVRPPAGAPTPGRVQLPPHQPAGEDTRSREALRLEERVDVVERLSEGAGASTAYSIDADTVRETAGGFENVLQVLQVLPGVAGTDDEHGRLAVRGSGPEHNVVVLDGVQVHNPYRFGELTSSFINPATVARVSLDASGLDAGHGGRLSSVTIIETRDGARDRKLAISGSLGLAAGDVLLEGRLPKTETGSWWATARGTYYRSLAGPFRPPATVPGFGDVQFKVSVRPHNQTRLTFFGLVGRETQNAREIDDDGPPGGEVSSYEGTNRLGFVNFLWTPGSRFVTTTTVSSYAHDARDFDTLPVAGPIFNRDTSVHDLAVRQRAIYAFSARHVMETGVEVHRLRTSWRMAGVKPPIFWRGIGPSTWGEKVEYPQTGEIDSHLARTQVGFWLQDRVPIGSRVTIEPGVRVDWNSFTGESSWQPRVRGTVRLGDTVLWAGVADQVQTPSHESLQGFDFFRVEQVDGERLRNERVRQFVVGFERPLAAGIDLRVEGYRRRFDCLLVQRLETDEERATRLSAFLTPDDMPLDSATLEYRPTVVPESTGKGTATGVEVMAHRSGQRLSGWVGYTFSKTTREMYGYAFPFDFDRPHTLSCAGTWLMTRRLRLSATWLFGSGFPVTPLNGDVFFSNIQRPDGSLDPIARPFRLNGRLVLGPNPMTRRLSQRNSDRLSGYSRTDIRVTYSTLGHWEFYGEVINLFAARNYEQATAAPDGVGPDGFVTRNNIYEKFDRFPTFGIRFRF